MELLNFSDTSKQAFIKGFWKGLAAPVMIFGNFEAPKRREIKPISLNFKTDAEALADDWKRIGMDFNKSIETYDKKASI